jgi:hypothetical protein
VVYILTFRLPTQSNELMPAIRRIEVREEPPLFRNVDTAAKEKEEDTPLISVSHEVISRACADDSRR